MGPGIDFPLIMHYTDTETGNGQPYFYFLNGHNDVTYFADQNFTPGLIETYEYNYFGNPNNFGNRNSLLYNAFEYDFEIGLYSIGSTYYNPSIGLVLKNLNYGKEEVPLGKQINIYPERINNIILKSISTDSEGSTGGGDEEDGNGTPICGNGRKESGEQCDDGDTDDTNCCDTNCKRTKNCKTTKWRKGVYCKWVTYEHEGRYWKICVPITGPY